MSDMSDLRITLHHINAMLEELKPNTKVRIHRAYNRVRLQIDECDTTRDTPPIGPKACLMYAEGMERALELLYYSE